MEQEKLYQEILKEAQAMQEELTAWRRQFHQMPELDLSLPKTSAFVQDKLTEMGIAYKLLVDGSCVVALIGKQTGKTPEKCFLLRSDMDGLPIKEDTGLSFASENGKMHACGHDLHAATLLGAAKLLKQHEEELCGIVKLVFQPGEETFRGAKAAIEDGLLEEPHVDAAFAMHVGSGFTPNCIAYGPAPMSSVYGFRIKVTGKGCHGAYPENGIDPINAAVHIHLALQELIAREKPSTKEGALTIGSLHAGSAANIIPQTAEMEGTLRVFDRKVRENLIRRIGEVVEDTAKTYRTKAELEVLYDVPPVENNEELSKEFLAVIHAMKPEEYLAPTYHVMGSEDFAFISERVPSCYFSIGAAVEDKSKIVDHHNPHVMFNEACLPTAAAAYACVAIDWLKRHGSAAD